MPSFHSTCCLCRVKKTEEPKSDFLPDILAIGIRFVRLIPVMWSAKVLRRASAMKFISHNLWLCKLLRPIAEST